MQTEWIGRSEGAEVELSLVDREDSIEIYTTRPDTMFGATFMVIAPEHPLVDEVLATPSPGADAGAIGQYVAAARSKSEVDRQGGGEGKTGGVRGRDSAKPPTRG